MRIASPQAIADFLAELQRRRRIHAWTAISGGGLLALFGPLVVTVIYVIKTSVHDEPQRFGFWGTFLIITLITLPIFFLIAKVSEGSLLESYADATDDYGSFRMTRGRGAVLILIFDIANIGPRLVLWGIGRLNGIFRLGHVDQDRVIVAITTLLSHDYGIKPAQLLLANERADQLEPLLAYMFHFQLIDMAKRGDRIWLTSATRQQLIQLRNVSN